MANSEANGVPVISILPVDVAVGMYVPSLMALHDKDPDGPMTNEEIQAKVERIVRGIVVVERERGSRPGRRRFVYAERHGHRINVGHPPEAGPMLTPEQEQIGRLKGRVQDLQAELELGRRNAVEMTEAAKTLSWMVQDARATAAAVRRRFSNAWAVAIAGWGLAVVAAAVALFR